MGRKFCHHCLPIWIYRCIIVYGLLVYKQLFCEWLEFHLQWIGDSLCARKLMCPPPVQAHMRSGVLGSECSELQLQMLLRMILNTQHGGTHKFLRTKLILSPQQFQAIACGKTFTLAGTSGNSVYFWGSKPAKHRRYRNTSESASPNQSINSGSRSFRSRKSSLGSFEDSGLDKSLDKNGNMETEAAGYAILRWLCCDVLCCVVLCRSSKWRSKFWKR